jgi:hypothetical protein
MQTFVETRLFTKLVQEYLSDDEYVALCSKRSWRIRKPATSSLAQEGFGNSDGASPAGASAVGFE